MIEVVSVDQRLVLEHIEKLIEGAGEISENFVHAVEMVIGNEAVFYVPDHHNDFGGMILDNLIEVANW